MEKYVMVIDEGTTGTRALLYNKDFQIVGQSYEEFTQYTPSEDRVEHDAEEIYNKSVEMCRKAMKQVEADNRFHWRSLDICEYISWLYDFTNLP